MLNNLSIKLKLFLLMILPILGMIYFAYINIDIKYQKMQESTNIHKITILNTKISLFIHQLQKERGLSSGFISSKGKKFKDKLSAQQTITDKQLKKLKQYLNYFNIISEDKKFQIFKKELSSMVEKLYITRAKIKSLSLQYEEVIEHYSRINTALLKFIYGTSKYTSNIDISRTILSYSNFLFAKEKMGIQRALITKILIDKKISEENRKKLYSLISFRKTYLNLFLELSDNNIKRFYSSTYKKELSQEIEKIENNLLSLHSEYDTKSSYWFEKITQKIEIQNIVANTLSEKLIDLSTSQKNDAYKNMVIYTLLALFILTITLYIVIFIFRNMSNNLKKIKNGILTISKTKTNEYKEIEISSDDDFGAISSTLNNIVKELTIKDEQNRQINEDIKAAEKKAVASAKAKSEFLANMSHEIRTPLNAVLGFIELLKEETKGGKIADYVSIIDSSSKSLLKIIEDILDFSKIESGKLDIDKVDFNTKAEFEVITHLFDAKCSQKNISLTLNLNNSLPQIINSDPLRIKQVITNLLSNAVKFTNEGKNIYVDIDYKDKLLFVSVKDEGIGIAQEKQKHIFEAFGQEDSSTTRKFGGTGLGLSISSELIRLLGGKLNVKSEIGNGSEFYFSIPVTLGKELKLELKDNNKITFTNKKILLVEDNKANQTFMKIVLKKMGLTFDIANDGLEAIERYKLYNTHDIKENSLSIDKNCYDAILMDENMPNMNGIEAAKQILKYEKLYNLKHTPIIALTANAIKGDRKRFLNAGMDEYLTKPLDKEKLMTVLSRIL